MCPQHASSYIDIVLAPPFGVLDQIAELSGEVSSSAARAKQGAARVKHLKATAKTTEKEMKVSYS